MQPFFPVLLRTTKPKKAPAPFGRWCLADASYLLFSAKNRPVTAMTREWLKGLASPMPKPTAVWNAVSRSCIGEILSRPDCEIEITMRSESIQNEEHAITFRVPTYEESI